MFKNMHAYVWIKLLRSHIFPIAKYGCEAWTIDQSARKTITSFEIKSYGRIEEISLIQKRGNDSVLEELGTVKNRIINTVRKENTIFWMHRKMQIKSLQTMIL